MRTRTKVLIGMGLGFFILTWAACIVGAVVAWIHLSNKAEVEALQARWDAVCDTPDETYLEYPLTECTLTDEARCCIYDGVLPMKDKLWHCKFLRCQGFCDDMSTEYMQCDNRGPIEELVAPTPKKE